MNGDARDLRESILSGLFSAWSRIDPEAAATTMMKEAPELQNQRYDLWNTWSQRDPEGMLNWVKTRPDLPGQTKEQMLNYVASSLLSVDINRAWAVAKDLPDRGEIVESIGRDLFARDPNAAMAWIAGLANRDDQERFYAAAGQLGTTTPELRKKILELLPETDRAAVSAQLSLLARSDPGAARAYWDALPAEMRAPVSQGVPAWLDSAPELAAVLVSDKLTTDAALQVDVRTNAVPASRVAVALAARDPAATREWISSLPPGMAAVDAAANFASHHGRFDRADVEEWLAAEPADSRLRSGLLRGLARLDSWLGDPAAAFAQVRQLAPEDPRRVNAFRDVYNAWSPTDPETAQRSFAALPLTEAERAALGEAFSN